MKTTHIGNDPLSVLKIIGENIRALRKSKGWSQERLALEAETERAHLSHIENGHKNMSVEFLCDIAQAMDVDFLDLFIQEQPD